MHCLQKCTLLSQNSALNPVSLSKQEMLNNLEKEFLPELHMTQKSVSEYRPIDVSLSLDTGIAPSLGQALEDPYQQQQAKVASAKRRNSKPPNFPVILEAARETDATVSSGENDTASISELRTSRSSPMLHKHPSPQGNPMLHKRPTTLSLKETEDFSSSPQERRKKGIMKQSPAASVPVAASSVSPRQVAFVNETLSSADAKPFEHTSVKQKTIQEKDEEGKEEIQLKPVLQHRRRVPRSEQKTRQMKVLPQNSTDADGEESGLDTPRSSISYPGPVLSSVSPVQTLENEVLPLTVAAEVHSSFSLSPLSTSVYKSPESTSPMQQPHKLSPQLWTSEEPKVSDDNFPSWRQQRPRLFRERSIHSDQDQPDEQTGQPREERSRLANKEHDIEDTESVVKTQQSPSPKKNPPHVPPKPQSKSPPRTKRLYEKGLSESLNYFPPSSISQYSTPASVNVESDEEETSGL